MEKNLPIGFRFSILHRAFRRQMDEQVKELDLTGTQCGVLGQLERLEHSELAEINQKALEEAAHVTHPTMTEILKKLEKKGFIRCTASTVDRRQKVISSTEKSFEIHQILQDCDARTFAMLCRGLSEAQRDTFLQSLDIMLQNARELAASQEPPCRKAHCTRRHGETHHHGRFPHTPHSPENIN